MVVDRRDVGGQDECSGPDGGGRRTWLLKGERAIRAERLVAERKAAAGLVAFVRGKEVSGRDQITEVLGTVVRDDDRATPDDAGGA